MSKQQSVILSKIDQQKTLVCHDKSRFFNFKTMAASKSCLNVHIELNAFYICLKAFQL